MDLFYAAAALKAVRRQGWVDKLQMNKPESVADHSYGVGLMSMILSDIVGLDTAKAVRMALLHDLAESKTGDLIPGQVPSDKKEEIENAAMSDILSGIPEPAGSACRDAWAEYQESKTEEARFVHEVDKLEMALQAAIYSRDPQRRNIEPFLESARSSVHNKHLQDMLDQILEVCQGTKKTS